MQLEKSSGRFPVTAVEVWEISETDMYLVWGTGPFLCIQPWQPSNDNVKFTVSDCDSVHIIRCFTSSLLVAAFGGKSLAIARKLVSGFHLQCKFAQLDDMVLDVALRGECNDFSSNIDCYVGYAHNFVDIATITASGEYVTQARVQCPDISVLFHMSFEMDSSRDGLTVASGTVFGKIILWRVDSAAACSTMLCRADDHEGVIFRIKWSEDRSRLVSVADDRTVRMWRIAYNNVGSISLPSGLELVFTAWGHVSRVWDVVFLSSAPDTDIATCSEDGTVKLWNAEGACTCTMRGHSHHVWRLAAAQRGALLISGGNDASLKVWDVAYQRRACPEDTISSVSLAPIPDWPPAIDPVEVVESVTVEPVTVEPVAAPTAPQEDNETAEELPLSPSKKKASVASRRANGVCSVRVSPCLRYVVVVLVDGGVWLVSVPQAQSSGEPEWVPLTHLRAIVSTVDASFSSSNVPGGSLRVRLSLALLNGSNTLLTVTVPPSGLPTIVSHNWTAHEMRTVNTWLSDSADSYLVTATVKGACSIWTLEDDVVAGALCVFKLPSQAIATASLIAHCPRLRSEYAVFGDARGSVYVYDLPAAASGASVAELAPVGTFAKVHGADPVSCIARFGSGFVTAGHDGMLHVYTEVIGQDSFSCGMTAVPTEASLGWAHTGKINCLPITTPDQVFVATDPDGVDSLYVCGYHGSLFVVLDVRQGYQLLRVEAGGWKRPHRCAMQMSTDGRALVQGLPACLFVCPAPLLKHSTALQLFGGFPSQAPGPVTTATSTLPLHLGCAGMGRVGYCAAFITAANPSDESFNAPLESAYVVVGGESSCVKVYSVPELALVQALSLSMNSSLKSLCSATSQASRSRGIVVGGGGKLQYYIWMFDRGVGCSGRSALGDVLYTGAEGGTWAKATQDHRILSVHCAYLGSSLLPAGSVYVERYAVLLCDSRGAVTIGRFEHSLLGAAGAPVRSFSVLQQVQASQCPLLSCSLLLRTGEQGHGASAPVLAAVGDTAGTVSVWKIGGGDTSADTVPGGEVAQVVQFSAHAMGANALSCCSLAGGKVGVFSAGDDQALSCAVVDTEADVLVGQTMVQGASGSAIKALKIAHSGAGRVSLAAVGYDQRLYVWQVNCERADAPAAKWECGSPVNVSDVGSLDVGVLPGTEKRVCCVVGEGIQLFALSA